MLKDKGLKLTNFNKNKLLESVISGNFHHGLRYKQVINANVTKRPLDRQCRDIGVFIEHAIILKYNNLKIQTLIFSFIYYNVAYKKC